MPDVVQQAAGGDHDLGVLRLHAVDAHHVGLDAAPVQQAEQPQRDVHHDLDVDPGVVRHPEPVRVRLRDVPPRLQLRVGVRRLQQRLEAAVAAGREP